MHSVYSNRLLHSCLCCCRLKGVREWISLSCELISSSILKSSSMCAFDVSLFRGDSTESSNLLERGTTQYYCVLLPMLRNDFKPSSNSNRGGGRMVDDPPWQVWRHEFIEVPLILLRKLPLRHSAAFVSAAVGCHTIFIARNKEECLLSKPSKQSRVLQANSHPQEGVMS